MANMISGIAKFLELWESDPDDQGFLPLRRGGQGHRNLTGTASSPAITFTKGHPQFVESLEDGVKDLVLLLIECFDCVTYSSCEGHANPDGQTLLRGRNVDILARNASEHQHLRNHLQVCTDYARLVPSDFVDLQLLEVELETEVGPILTLDLNFIPMTDVPDEYFYAVAPVYERLLGAIADCKVWR